MKDVNTPGLQRPVTKPSFWMMYRAKNKMPLEVNRWNLGSCDNVSHRTRRQSKELYMELVMLAAMPPDRSNLCCLLHLVDMSKVGKGIAFKFGGIIVVKLCCHRS